MTLTSAEIIQRAEDMARRAHDEVVEVEGTVSRGRLHAAIDRLLDWEDTHDRMWLATHARLFAERWF